MNPWEFLQKYFKVAKEHFRGPVGDKRFKQPVELDWKNILLPLLDVTSFQKDHMGDRVYFHKKKKYNIPEVPEWKP
jgi:hypothetical protein